MMVSRNIGFLTLAAVFMILMTPTITTTGSSLPNPTEISFEPSSVDIRQLLPNPEMNVPPTVYIRGTTGEFTSSHYVPTDSSSSSYVALTWTHTAGTPIDGYSGDGYDIPDCEDFIYFVQEFDWDLEVLPDDAYLNMSFSVETTGDFATHEESGLMFKLYVWLIDSSGNWRRIFRTYPPYPAVYQSRIADLNYFDIHEPWEGMIEDSSGVQEDPTDTLTLAVGLVPTDNFYYFAPLGTNPWNEYNGIVSAKIRSVSLTTFIKADPDPDEMLIPLANDTWGRKVSAVFDEVPEQFENASDLCVGIDTGEDSSVYVLVESRPDYDFYVITGQYFLYQTILKYDSRLNLIWARNHRNMTTALDICVKDGFIYTVGCDRSDDSNDLLLTKWSADGTILWETIWDTGIDEYGGAVGVIDDGSIFVLGERSTYRRSIPPYIHQEVLLKFNSNGVLEWNITIDLPVWAEWLELEIAPNGIYTYDGFQLTYRDFLGIEQWTTSGNCFTVDSDGNLYSSLSFPTVTGIGIQFIKTDSNGDLLWSTNYTISYPGGWDEKLVCVSMSVAPDGSLLVYVGNTWLSVTHYLVKFSPEGEYQWHKDVGDNSWFYPDKNFGFINVAPNGVTYLALTLNGLDVGIYSYDVGVFSFVIPVELLLISGAGLGIVVISLILVKKRPQKDYYSEYKERYDL